VIATCPRENRKRDCFPNLEFATAGFSPEVSRGMVEISRHVQLSERSRDPAELNQHQATINRRSIR
jgi:hypothetical protein